MIIIEAESIMLEPGIFTSISETRTLFFVFKSKDPLIVFLLHRSNAKKRIIFLKKITLAHEILVLKE